MNTAIESFQAYFKTESNMFVMDTQMALLSPYITEYLNRVGRIGHTLPVPEWMKVVL